MTHPELSMVSLTRPVEADGRLLPSGSTGTVSRLSRERAYEVEFNRPFMSSPPWKPTPSPNEPCRLSVAERACCIRGRRKGQGLSSQSPASRNGGKAASSRPSDFAR